MDMNERIDSIKYFIGLGIIKIFCRGYVRYLHAMHGAVCEKKI